MDFTGIDNDKIKAIQNVNGPLLIIAGPGTGKTFTLIKRALYMVQDCGIKPESIMITTFTEKAAKEIITRLTRAFAKNNIVANINEMYIGTFHSICLRILKDNIEFTRLGNNCRIMEGFDQQYFVRQHIWDFQQLPYFKEAISNKNWWEQAKTICKTVNNLTEELVNVDKLINDKNHKFQAIGYIMEYYQELLAAENLMDFSSIQVEAYKLLTEHPEVLEKLQGKLSYFMIDEYQDTNYIQEQLLLLLGNNSKNICVVGDDDQGLYRFRGATIRNILTFEDTLQKAFPGITCSRVDLVTNYRSNSDIIDFYNKWMHTTNSGDISFSWGPNSEYRYDKQIVANTKTTLKSPAVAKLMGGGKLENWYYKVADFLTMLHTTGKITDFNQVAFLFRSVSGKRVQTLANVLESRGINVYSPRSSMFFDREEIRIVIGCLMLLFPSFTERFKQGKYNLYSKDVEKQYENYILDAEAFIDDNPDLKIWIEKHANIHSNPPENMDYSYKGLIYRMISFPCFKNILETDLNLGVVDLRPLRNLALLTQIIGQFEYLERVDVLTKKNIEKKTEKLFAEYLRLYIIEKLNEYEDDADYAPSGCVSFMTIHQSKGLEFPIVFVAPMDQNPKKNKTETVDEIKEKYARKEYEPFDEIPYFDFWRLFYTAFSRPKNLLILTAPDTKGMPGKVLREVFSPLPEVNGRRFDINEFTFDKITPTDLKSTYSFTSHISVYQACPTQYKFFKELGFAPHRVGPMFYGTLVHATIEEIHKAALRGESHKITKDQVDTWFFEIYNNLMKAEHTYLEQATRDAALKQVQDYVKKRNGNWNNIKQAEYDVSLVKDEYIIDGKIDLIQGDNDTVEIVDFKSSQKPDPVKDHDIIERYMHQLQVYSHLVEERSNHQLKVSKMHLYYTGESKDPLMTFPYDSKDINQTMQQFDDIVHKIMAKDFGHRTNDKHVCNDCDFRYYCKKV